MSARLKGRRRQVAALLPPVAAWAAGRNDIVGLILVGSYARDRPRIGSDVDLILITTSPTATSTTTTGLPNSPRADG